MVIGGLTGYATSGYGSGANLRAQVSPDSPSQRQPVTLDAQLDPKTPNEYSVTASPSVIPPPERTSDTKSSDRRNQNNDPASRAFLAIANYQSRRSNIDVMV